MISMTLMMFDDFYDFFDISDSYEACEFCDSSIPMIPKSPRVVPRETKRVAPSPQSCHPTLIGFMGISYICPGGCNTFQQDIVAREREAFASYVPVHRAGHSVKLLIK